MDATISVHSSRGGTGKTIVASNLATVLAKKGVNVALVDLDFRAPSLYHIFKEFIKEPVDYWLNNYLDSQCRPNDFLVNLEIPNLKGSLSAGFANPSIQAMQSILSKSRVGEARALRKLLDLKKFLFKNVGVDICIYDTSPGIQYSSLNALMSCDKIVYVSTPDLLEINQVSNMLNEYEDIFTNKTSIILNKVFPETDYWSNDEQRKYINQLSEELRNSVIDIIPCYCDLLYTKNRLLTLKKPNHPFLKKMRNITQKLIFESPSRKMVKPTVP